MPRRSVFPLQRQSSFHADMRDLGREITGGIFNVPDRVPILRQTGTWMAKREIFFAYRQFLFVHLCERP